MPEPQFGNAARTARSRSCASWARRRSCTDADVAVSVDASPRLIVVAIPVAAAGTLAPIRIAVIDRSRHCVATIEEAIRCPSLWRPVDVSRCRSWPPTTCSFAPGSPCRCRHCPLAADVEAAGRRAGPDAERSLLPPVTSRTKKFASLAPMSQVCAVKPPRCSARGGCAGVSLVLMCKVEHRRRGAEADLAGAVDEDRVGRRAGRDA